MTHCLHSQHRAFGTIRARVPLWSTGLAVLLSAVCLTFCWPAAASWFPADEDMALDQQCLREAYPEIVLGLEQEGDTVWLRLRNGGRVVYADRTAPVYETDGVLHDATISQSMAEPYPLGEPDTLTPQGNAGRNRSVALLSALYGDSPKTLHLKSVSLGLVGKGRQVVRLSEAAAQAFARIAPELEQLAANPRLSRFIFPLGGGQYWRTISGTRRLSAHAFGIAVDLNPDAGPYWRVIPKRTSLYPYEIVNIFEKNGFIWGGRWAHFDLMHFEYRPEIICKARYRQGRAQMPSERF